MYPAVLIPDTAVDVTLTSDFDITATSLAFARELYVGTGGTPVIAVMAGDGGTSHTYLNVPDGSSLYGKFVTVLSSGHGTTASNIVARR